LVFILFSIQRGIGNGERRRRRSSPLAPLFSRSFSLSNYFPLQVPVFSRNPNTLLLKLPSAEIYPLSHLWVSPLHSTKLVRFTSIGVQITVQVSFFFSILCVFAALVVRDPKNCFSLQLCCCSGRFCSFSLSLDRLFFIFVYFLNDDRNCCNANFGSVFSFLLI